ncbi:mitochondrial inner membrane protein [Coprinopsis cinerea okayama7|uniref:Succinate dehydrogenase [ubiquinone] cytochrome b small subunit n=1 Tax=Coprinopsis cinerea (strain Okayama-7 / 130 / ATCC MYA-4618 / FGSC 9003) TaxID=240176 RepID=A8PBH9_COPC7|nr:mitochondrial inner membrane protein [Coprinopsis cinerea okayama7\|eukprot:XP_001840187.1 mitochondrial inner membrane protein [Coprinopsis cinerea okayama7\
MSASLVLRSNVSRAIARRAALPSVSQVRYASQDPNAYVPGGPVLRGTVNDATTFPPPSRAAGSYHWAFEKILSAALVPMTAAAFVTGGTQHPVLDGILGLSLIVHSHFGFDQILIDYVHKRKYPTIAPIATWSVRAATVAAAVGVFQFNTNDIGLTELIAKVWTA